MPRSISVLVPSISHRLQAWEDIQKRLHAEPHLRPRPTITLSRAFGCEGFPIADKVKMLLEKSSAEPWNVYDKSLLEAVGTEEGVSMRVMKNLGITAGRLERLGMAPPEYYEQVRAFEAIGRHIVHIATGGNAVIVGRGGAVLCALMKNCFHFRLDAPFDWRVQSIMKRLELPRDEAEAFVRANGTRREEFSKSQLKVDPANPSLYDAVFNNARNGNGEIAAAIVAYVNEAWPRLR